MPALEENAHTRDGFAAKLLSLGSLTVTLQLCALAAFAMLCGMVLHFFFRYAGSAPYLATDDALVNISYSLSELGRLGFPAGPIQAGTNTLRTDGFFNYGPWYFLVGGALAWLLGMSLEIQRAIHPAGIIFLAGLAIAVFRRESIAAGVGFAAVVLYMFHYTHWPMVRPDIMVSVLALTAIAAATAATRTERPAWWGVAAFFATAAVTQHLIAWTLAPAFLIIWGVAQWYSTPGEARASLGKAGGLKRLAISFLAAALGFAIAGAIYLVAIQFRISEVIQHLSSYSADVAPIDVQGGYLQVLYKHFSLAWGGSVPYWLRNTAAVGFATAVVLLLGSRMLPLEVRRRTIALLMPPVVSAVAYQLGLGFYGNWHSGYAILSQIAVLWAAAAAVAAITRLVAELVPVRIAGLPEAALCLIVIAGAVSEMKSFLVRPSGWMSAARQWVDIEGFTDAALAPIPMRASVWGTFALGFESGIRADLVQFGEGMLLASNVKPEARGLFAPEFLVFGYREQNDIAAGYIRSPQASNSLDGFAKLFADYRYELVHLASAPPYGAVRVYRRFPRSSASSTTPPSVMVNDGTGKQWGSRLLPPLAVGFQTAKPVSFELRYGNISFDPSQSDDARASLVADLPPGNYLMAVEIQRQNTGAGVLIATTASKFVGNNSELGHGFIAAPYFPDETSVHMVLPHSGGALYLSQFDADPRAQFRVATIWPIETFDRVVSTVALPPLDRWSTATAAKIVSSSAEVMEIIGDEAPSGYQLISPEIAVVPRTDIRVLLPVTSRAQRVGFGILDTTGRWLVSPRAGTNTLELNTGDRERITIVISNMYTREMAGPSHFVVQRGAMTVTTTPAGRTYTDWLTVCHRTRKHLRPDLCQ